MPAVLCQASGTFPALAAFRALPSLSVATGRVSGPHLSFSDTHNFREVLWAVPQADSGSCPCGDSGCLFLAHLTFIIGIRMV